VQCAGCLTGEGRNLGRLSILRTNRRDVLEQYWQDETDWLSTVEFLPTDDPEARLLAADVAGYRCGYPYIAIRTLRSMMGLERNGDVSPIDGSFRVADQPDIATYNRVSQDRRERTTVWLASA